MQGKLVSRLPVRLSADAQVLEVPFNDHCNERLAKMLPCSLGKISALCWFDAQDYGVNGI